MKLRYAALPTTLGIFVTLVGCGGSPPPVSATSSATPVPTVVATGGAAVSATPTSTPSFADQPVSITTCKRDSDGYVTLKGIVKNTTSDVTDVNMTFEVVDSDGVRIDTLIGEVSKLTPGQKSRFYTNTTQTNSKKIVCRLLDIQFTDNS